MILIEHSVYMYMQMVLYQQAMYYFKYIEWNIGSSMLSCILESAMGTPVNAQMDAESKFAQAVKE